MPRYKLSLMKRYLPLLVILLLCFLNFNQSSDATLLPSSEKKKLASRCDFLVFCLRKIMLNFSVKVDSQFFYSLQPVQYQAFASKIDGQLSSRGVKKFVQTNFFTPRIFFELVFKDLISLRMRRCRHPQKRKNSQAGVTSSFFVYEKSC